jgi:hypothetical protein
MPNVCEYWIEVKADAGMVSEIEGLLRPAMEELSGQAYYGRTILHFDRLDPSHDWQGQMWIGLSHDVGESCCIPVECGVVIRGASQWAPPMVFAGWLANRLGETTDCGYSTNPIGDELPRG